MSLLEMEIEAELDPCSVVAKETVKVVLAPDETLVTVGCVMVKKEAFVPLTTTIEDTGITALAIVRCFIARGSVSCSAVLILDVRLRLLCPRFCIVNTTSTAGSKAGTVPKSNVLLLR